MKQFNPCTTLALLFCLWLVSLSGCAEVGPNGSTGYPVQRALIGKTAQQLLACAGQPGSERPDGDRVVFLYHREASLFEESFPGSKGSVPMVRHGCHATIVLQQDRVSDVRYESEPSSYRGEDHCEEIFASCVAP
jgi:hypothetical protein